MYWNALIQLGPSGNPLLYHMQRRRDVDLPPSPPTHECQYFMEADSIIRAQRSGVESYCFVFSRKPAKYKENGRRQHMASGYHCVSHSYDNAVLRACGRMVCVWRMVCVTRVVRHQSTDR